LIPPLPDTFDIAQQRFCWRDAAAPQCLATTIPRLLIEGLTMICNANSTIGGLDRSAQEETMLMRVGEYQTSRSFSLTNKT
jgi:hypothetical protein